MMFASLCDYEHDPAGQSSAIRARQLLILPNCQFPRYTIADLVSAKDFKH